MRFGISTQVVSHVEKRNDNEWKFKITTPAEKRRSFPSTWVIEMGRKNHENANVNFDYVKWIWGITRALWCEADLTRQTHTKPRLWRWYVLKDLPGQLWKNCRSEFNQMEIFLAFLILWLTSGYCSQAGVFNSKERCFGWQRRQNMVFRRFP